MAAGPSYAAEPEEDAEPAGGSSADSGWVIEREKEVRRGPTYHPCRRSLQPRHLFAKPADSTPATALQERRCAFPMPDESQLKRMSAGRRRMTEAWADGQKMPVTKKPRPNPAADEAAKPQEKAGDDNDDE